MAIFNLTRVFSLGLLAACVGGQAPTLPQNTWREPVVTEHCEGERCFLFVDVGPLRTFSLDLFAGDEPLTAGRFREGTAPQSARLVVRSLDGEVASQGSAYDQGDSLTLPHGAYRLIVTPSVLSLGSGWPSRIPFVLNIDETMPDRVRVDVFQEEVLLNVAPEVTVEDQNGPGFDGVGPGRIVGLDEDCGTVADSRPGEAILRLPRGQCTVTAGYQVLSSGGIPRLDLAIRTNVDARTDLDARVVPGTLRIAGAPDGVQFAYEATVDAYELDATRTASFSMRDQNPGRIFLPEVLPPSLPFRVRYSNDSLRCHTRVDVPTDSWSIDRTLLVDLTDAPCSSLETITATTTFVADASVRRGPTHTVHACELRPEIVINGRPSSTMDREEGATDDVCVIRSEIRAGAPSDVLMGDSLDVAIRFRPPNYELADRRTLPWKTIVASPSADLGTFGVTATRARFLTGLVIDGERVLQPTPGRSVLPANAKPDALQLWVLDRTGARSRYELNLADIQIFMREPEFCDDDDEDSRRRCNVGPRERLYDSWEVTLYEPNVVAAEVGVLGTRIRSDTITEDEEGNLDFNLIGEAESRTLFVLSDGRLLDDVVELDATPFCVNLLRRDDDGVSPGLLRSRSCAQPDGGIAAVPGSWDLVIEAGELVPLHLLTGPARRIVEL
ncbi:MAG: hypothetical protein AAGE52_17925 [Myxococcota bacterium]